MAQRAETHLQPRAHTLKKGTGQSGERGVTRPALEPQNRRESFRDIGEIRASRLSNLPRKYHRRHWRSSKPRAAKTFAFQVPYFNLRLMHPEWPQRRKSADLFLRKEMSESRCLLGT